MTIADRARSLGPRLVAFRIPIVALAITVLAWPFPNTKAVTGLDPSWQIAVHMLVGSPIRQGVDFVFTYGPLGFLAVPHPYVGPSTLLALAASFAVYAGLFALMLVAAARILPLWAAAVVTLLVARIVDRLPPYETLQVLVFLLAIEAIRRRGRWHSLGVAVLFGVLTGIAVLGKLNVAVFLSAMGAIAVLTTVRPAWRGLAAYTAAAAATATTLWLATGQRLLDVPAYMARSLEVISSYSAAMMTDRTTNQLWVYLAFAAILGLIAWIAWEETAEWPRRERLGLLALGLVLGFAAWKIAFTRWFLPYAFSTLAIVVFAFAGARLGRRTWLLATLCASVAAAGVIRPTPIEYANVFRSGIGLLAEVRDAMVPGRGQETANQTRSDLQARYAIDQNVLAAVTGHTVQIDPWETAAAFAYPQMTWDPLPVFQPYGTWSASLDELNAARLRSPEAPDRILRSYAQWTDPPDYVREQVGRPLRPGEVLPATVDGRFQWFESPAGMLETFCRYREIAVSDRWEALARTESSCASPEPVQTVTARAGERVAVPAAAPGTFMIVRIHGLEGSLLERIQTALYKGTLWFVTVDDTRYRLVAATAADGLMLAVPAAVDGTPPFAFGDPIRTIAVSAGVDGRQSTATLTYEFMQVELH